MAVVFFYLILHPSVSTIIRQVPVGRNGRVVLNNASCHEHYKCCDIYETLKEDTDEFEAVNIKMTDYFEPKTKDPIREVKFSIHHTGTR